MSPTQVIFSVLGLGVSIVLGCWGILAYFNRQNRELWESTEKHIMQAIRELKADIARLQDASSEDRERVHQVELSFRDLKAEIADKYASAAALSRLREDCARDIAQMRTYCARKRGESSN